MHRNLFSRMHDLFSRKTACILPMGSVSWPELWSRQLRAKCAREPRFFLVIWFINLRPPWSAGGVGYDMSTSKFKTTAHLSTQSAGWTGNLINTWKPYFFLKIIYIFYFWRGGSHYVARLILNSCLSLLSLGLQVCTTAPGIIYIYLHSDFYCWMMRSNCTYLWVTVCYFHTLDN
jgi:hypothetical protein